MSADTVSVVAGGWSVKSVDRARIPGTIIAVKEAAFHLPRCDAIVGMDRQWVENRWATLRQMQVPTWLRVSSVQNIHGQWPWLRRFANDPKSFEFSEENGFLNGGNSGFCAFNLAYQMRPKRICLFGFDMGLSPDGEEYWYQHHWKLKSTRLKVGLYREWSKTFRSAAAKCKAAGIEVLNVSAGSAIAEFRRVEPEAVYEDAA